MNEELDAQPAKSNVVPCVCTIVLGLLVIVFAWWSIRWSPIILTILGALMIIRGLVNQCCCASASCGSTKEE